MIPCLIPSAHSFRLAWCVAIASRSAAALSAPYTHLSLANRWPQNLSNHWNPGISLSRTMILPLLGERAGVRADVQSVRRGWISVQKPKMRVRCRFRQRMFAELEQRAEGGGGALRQETAVNKPDRIVAEELQRLQWTEADLRLRRKSDPEKLRIAARCGGRPSCRSKVSRGGWDWGVQRVRMPSCTLGCKRTGNPTESTRQPKAKKSMPRKRTKLRPDPFHVVGFGFPELDG